MPGVLLCCLVHQAHRGATGAGSYSVVQRIRRLMGQPLYCSPTDAGCGERGHGDAPPPVRNSAVSPCFHGAWLSSTGISHHDLLPHIPWILLSTVNSCPHPGVASQSLNSSSQPLCLPGDQRPCPGYAWLQQGLSDSDSI